jgi:hypothetical protein
MATMPYRAAILFPAPADPAQSSDLASDLDKTRLAATAAALRAAGIEAVGAPYSDDTADAVRAQLLRADGVLVWVNPVERGRDRRVLDAMLEDVAAAGVFVSAHPAVIRKMGTKEVLYRTRAMGWGCDTRLYPTAEALREELPRMLAASGPRVLKQIRGNGGDGVWKVERATPAPDAPVRVRHAKRGSVEDEMPLDALLQRFEPYLAGGGQLIDQPYQPRLTDGMIRCYLVGGRVAGFGEQRVNALYPAAPGADPNTAPAPGPRLYYPPTRPDFQPLKEKLETEWVAEMCRTLALDPAELPVLWDADFLYGPKDATGADTYVLCEINVSSVYPFPDEALAPLAAAVRDRLAERR